jgi:hypothetical protein
VSAKELVRTSGPGISTHWNARRQEVTHKITKQGTSAFLLFNDAGLLRLRDLIDAALRGASDDRVQ